MADRITIKASIISKLQGLSSVDSSNVKGYEGAEPDGYPFVTCVCIGSEAEQQDEINIMRTYQYRVRILIDMNEAQEGNEWAEETMMIVTNEVIDAFDDDYCLGNTVENIIAVSDNMLYDISEGGIMRVSEIILNVESLYTIT